MAGLSVPLAMAALVACAADGDPSATGQPQVVATTTQVGSVAREVGGDAIDLTVLLAPGVEAHDFALTPEQGAALEGADIILVSGAGLEDWLADTIAAVGAEDRVRDISEGIALRSPDAIGEDGEAAGAVDPHYWLSGPNAVPWSATSATPWPRRTRAARRDMTIGQRTWSDVSSRPIRRCGR